MPDESEEPELSPTATPGAERYASALRAGGGAAASHEFNQEDRTGAHRLVATSMLVVLLVVAIKQDWWKHVRDWISEKTHGPAKATKPGGGGGGGEGFTP